jgi:hypothetical protein
MNATVAWSYQLLGPDEQRAFRRFGALPGVFPIDAAAAVLAGRESASGGSDDALRVTAGLIDKSLLQLRRAETSVVATRPLYQMLETVRAYAALELTSAGEQDDALEGLVRYCTTEAALAADGLVGPGRMAESRARRSRDLPPRPDPARRARPSRRSVGHRLGVDVLLADSGPCSRGPQVVRTDPEPALASAGCRVESAPRGSSDAVRPGRPQALTRRGHARARARPKRRRYRYDRAG